MRWLLPLLVLLAGCPSWTAKGIYAAAKDGRPLNGTSRPCQMGAQGVAAFEWLAPVAADELHRAGLCEQPAKALDGMRDKVAICIVEQPDRCRGLGDVLVSGCTNGWNIQVSRWSHGKDTLWRTFAHEVTELLLWRCNHYTASHSPAALAAEQRVWQRYQEHQ